ncbi:MAG: Peptide chain release factor RF-2 [Parcubacteria group bacterium GW2011_GWC1_43_30]|nr:MAG: Peptide chain release factor RF-2 [Parcubacteria group bacterium GW2011_GWC1_43_30]
MASAEFWADKDRAQRTLREHEVLKNELAGVGKYDAGGAVMTIFSGAGGDDAEDFSRIILAMYLKFFDNRKWSYSIIHKNENDHGGYRNITLEINGKNIYGTLKNESGVHRLVRISPFNAKALRHTSFSMVEVIPKFEKLGEIKIPPDDIKVEYSKSSGPGGQNVNKRETAVRKLYKLLEDERKAKERGMYVSKTTQIEWGNQIRSYVLHPYKMVKDHRTNVEVCDIEKVLNGDIDKFIEAERLL